VVLVGTCKVPEVVQCGDDGGASSLQEEQHHDREGEVGDPGPGDTAGDAVSSGPTAHGEHQMTHPRVQLSIQVEQLGALYRHPVVNMQNYFGPGRFGLWCGYSFQHVRAGTSKTSAGRTLHLVLKRNLFMCLFIYIYFRILGVFVCLSLS